MSDKTKASIKIKSFSSLELIPGSYSEVFSAAAKHSFFYSRPWVTNYINTVVEQDKTTYSILGLEEFNIPKALLFTQTFRSNQILQYGNKLSCLSNFYASLSGPIIDYEETNIDELIYEMFHHVISRNPKIDMIDLKPLDNSTSTFNAIISVLKNHGWITQEYFCFGNWYLPVHDLDFDDYIAARPSQLRNTLKRKKKKFEKESNSRIDIITGPNGLQKAVNAFLSIYEKSWKKPEPYPTFLPGLIRTCAENGCLRLGVAWVDGKPAAAQLWIVDNGIASIYKLAYDPQYNKLSVGSLLTMALMEFVFKEDKVRCVDYLTGDDAYKKDWMTHRRERVGVIAFNTRTLAGQFGAILNISGRSIKQILNRIKNKVK